MLPPSSTRSVSDPTFELYSRFSSLTDWLGSARKVIDYLSSSKHRASPPYLWFTDDSVETRLLKSLGRTMKGINRKYDLGMDPLLEAYVGYGHAGTYW